VWEDYGSKKIVVKVPSYEVLKELYDKCQKEKIPSYMISDAGKTQVEPGTVTVLGIGPGKIILKITLFHFNSDISDKINKITGKLKLM